MKKQASNVRTTTFQITGMHCASCDILVKTKVGTLKDVIEVIPDYRNKKITARHTGELTIESVNAILCEYGYTASTLDDVLVETPYQDRLIETLVIASILGIVYYFLNELHLLPDNLGGSATSITGALILGLIASASTCMATTGALFTTFLHRKHEKHNIVVSALFFTVGRLASYAIFGYILGYFGKGFSYITQLGTLLNVIVAIVLIAAGLDMLRLISLRSVLSLLPPLPPHIFSKKITQRAGGSAFLLGFITYFLPCGFTISTQAYALSTGNPWFSSQIMFAFALGTIPSLILITVLSRVRNNTVYQYFLKVVGVMILAVGMNYIYSSLTLRGLSFPSAQADTEFGGERALIENGKQVVRMTATSSGYSPSQFVVRKNIPVLWKIDGKEIYGCQGTLQSPQAGIALTYLKEGNNEFEFIPKEIGFINFSCSMGMFSGRFKVIE